MVDETARAYGNAARDPRAFPTRAPAPSRPRVALRDSGAFQWASGLLTARMEQNRAPAASSSSSERGSLVELKKLLQEFDTAMLVTSTDDGLLRARPMAIQEPAPELDCDLWFATSIDSEKMEEIARHPNVCVTCLRGRGSAYISISARASARRDRELVRKLFKPDWKVWWPEGPDDPQIAFLEMQVERAEYWEPAGGSVRILYEMAKSLVHGEPADRNLPAPKRI